MAESIGEKLRLARETRGVALRDISEQTRISMRFLEAIESDDYRRLPGGIFNRSFIRAYAKFVGYDEQQAMEEYATTMRERGQPEDDTDKAQRSMVYTDGHGRSPLTTLLLAIVILAILSLCVWAALYFYQRGVASQPPGTPQPFVAGTPPPGSPSRASQIHGPGRYVSVPNICRTREGQHEFTA
jgi:cytoskeletal protein RodZ